MKKFGFIFLMLTLAIFSCTKTKEAPVDTTVRDYDGNVYDTMRLGSQLWLKQNLRTKHYNDGTPIPNELNDSIWKTLTTGAYVYYNHDTTMDTLYGLLYNWHAVNTGKLAPPGWHVPSTAEWDTLMSFLGGDTAALYKVMATGTTHWAPPNSNANNLSRLSILPAGNHNGGGGPPFSGLTFYTGLWTSAESSATNAWMRNVQATHVKVDLYNYNKNFGFSVRCVKDE